MKKHLLFFVCLAVCLAGCASGSQPTDSRQAVYTHAELEAMPADELLDLFLEQGLVLSEEIKTVLTEAEIAAYLKQEFAILSQGITARSMTIYADFAEQVQAVYEQLTTP